jgi:hypothetical protein
MVGRVTLALSGKNSCVVCTTNPISDSEREIATRLHGWAVAVIKAYNALGHWPRLDSLDMESALIEYILPEIGQVVITEGLHVDKERAHRLALKVSEDQGQELMLRQCREWQILGELRQYQLDTGDRSKPFRGVRMPCGDVQSYIDHGVALEPYLRHLSAREIADYAHDCSILISAGIDPQSELLQAFQSVFRRHGIKPLAGDSYSRFDLFRSVQGRPELERELHRVQRARFRKMLDDVEKRMRGDARQYRRYSLLHKRRHASHKHRA